MWRSTPPKSSPVENIATELKQGDPWGSKVWLGGIFPFRKKLFLQWQHCRRSTYSRDTVLSLLAEFLADVPCILSNVSSPG
jgi:hypothetical protein